MTQLKIFSATLLIVGFVAQAHASPAKISCSNGAIEDAGDAHFQVDLLEDGIEFFPYEGSIPVDATQVVYNSGTYSVVNQSVTTTSEGEFSTVLVNALLIHDSAANTLQVALSLDGQQFNSYQLTCVEK